MARRVFVGFTAISPTRAPRPGRIRSRDTRSSLNSNLPTRPERMRPTSRWSSMQWTCSIADASTDSVWSRRTAISPGLRPGSASMASMCLASASRKRRRASGRPVEGSYTPRTCAPARRAKDAGATAKSLLPVSAATPIIKKVITQMESEDGWVALGEVGKQLANLASDFDPRTFGFRKLSDLVRKTDSFEIEEYAKGGSMRIRVKSATGPARQSRTAKAAPMKAWMFLDPNRGRR